MKRNEPHIFGLADDFQEYIKEGMFLHFATYFLKIGKRVKIMKVALQSGDIFS